MKSVKLDRILSPTLLCLITLPVVMKAQERQKGSLAGLIDSRDEIVAFLAGATPAPAETGSDSFVQSTAKLVPAKLRFDAVPTGMSSSPKTVTLTNTGTSNLNITAIVIAGVDPADFLKRTNVLSNSGRARTARLMSRLRLGRPANVRPR